MSKKTYLLGDGKGMHRARIKGPAAGYALCLLSLGIKEEEDG
jgi:hypothetical protein